MKLAGALVVLLVASTAFAETASLPKKDRERLGKAPNHAALPRIGVKPPALVNLFNEWTNEWLAVDPLLPPTSAMVNSFLRDHYTNESMKMDPELLPTLLAAAKNFHSDVVDIVSGFRHPKYNLILRKKGHQVARDSQHTHGNAVDFFIPQVTTQDLHKWAKAQHLGGVGLYLESGFVHMDTAAIRYWSGD